MNLVVAWEYGLFVDEHVAGANLQLPAIQGCLVVATVSAPPAVVCFEWYMFDVLLRYRRVHLLVLLQDGPMFFFTVSSVISCV